MQQASTLASESELAGSAGMASSTVLVSTETTPIGTPPSLARPTTTVCAQGERISWNVFLSKNPLCHCFVSAMYKICWLGSEVCNITSRKNMSNYFTIIVIGKKDQEARKAFIYMIKIYIGTQISSIIISQYHYVQKVVNFV